MVKKFISISVFGGVEYNESTTPPGTYDLENLYKEHKRNNAVEGYATEEKDLFSIKSNLSVLGTFIEKKPGEDGKLIFF